MVHPLWKRVGRFLAKLNDMLILQLIYFDPNYISEMKENFVQATYR